MPGIRVVGESVACESTVKSEIEEGIAAAMQDVVEALTKPLTPEEKSPKQQTGKTPRVAFKGSLQEVNRFYYSKGWTDGLPIIPPTEEAVQEMMTGTDLPADHVVAKLIPRLGKATVEKIAINAVMAGALPTHMPVLIAAVQALMDPRSRFDTFGVSTGSWAPFFVINGPIRKDIHINCSSGALSPGDIANAAIGRAVGLIVKNIGGVRKGIEDMGKELRGYTSARILDRNFDAVSLFAQSRTDKKHTARRHCLDRIGDQVYQHLLYLVFVKVDSRQVFAESELCVNI